MLVPLFVAASFTALAPTPKKPTVKPAPRVSLPFTVNVPAIPFFQNESLPMTPRRQLIPLATALTLDEPALEAREEEDLVTAINNERASRGLGTLALDPLLSEAARAHCREMCSLNYFAHRSPTRTEATPIDRYLDELQASGEKRPSEAIVGENIFYASITNTQYSVTYAHQRLMASPSHRQNILEPRFTKVGVGLYRDSQGQFWVTEMFLRDS